MKFLRFFFALVTLFSFNRVAAQSGASGSEGTFINYNNYVNGPRTIGGDLDVALNGYLQIGTNGTMEIMGATTNTGTIEIDSNGVLSIYGDVYNAGNIIVKKGATVHFYGNVWKNTTSAKVTDGDIITNTVPGGDVNFIGARPAVSGSWLLAGPYLGAYSIKNSKQYTDGGNVPMDIVMHLQNTNGVELINTATKIEGKLQWDVAKGNIVLGNNDLVFSRNSTQDGFRADRFAITSGTGHVTKENFTGNWIFPVGRDTNDYTPAAIDNASANTMHVLVQNYESSASEESTDKTMADGMQRTWNIYADKAVGVSTINLQHNVTTNQSAYSDDYNFVTRWNKTSPNNTGDKISVTAWQNNDEGAGTTGNLSSIGVVSGTSMRNRTYRDFATSATDALAFYTKSSEAFKPVVGKLLMARADSMKCEVSVQFKSGEEKNISKFQLQHSADGITFTTITTFDPKGDSTEYRYMDVAPKEGLNYYRIVMIEASGDYTISGIFTTTVNCSGEDAPIVLYPNPATNFINIAGLDGHSEIRIINMHGRVMSAVSTTNVIETIDISGLPAAPYIAQIITGEREKLTSIKFIKL